MKNVIIFGSSGFIGNNILKHLETKECNAMGFSSKTCNLLHRSDIQKAFSLVSGDISLVICSSITPPEANSIESMLSNIKMIDNIVKATSTNRLEKIIFLEKNTMIIMLTQTFYVKTLDSEKILYLNLLTKILIKNC